MSVFFQTAITIHNTQVFLASFQIFPKYNKHSSICLDSVCMSKTKVQCNSYDFIGVVWFPGLLLVNMKTPLRLSNASIIEWWIRITSLPLSFGHISGTRHTGVPHRRQKWSINMRGLKGALPWFMSPLTIIYSSGPKQRRLGKLPRQHAD